jgi:hypothetical protein
MRFLSSLKILTILGISTNEHKFLLFFVFVSSVLYIFLDMDLTSLINFAYNILFYLWLYLVQLVILH